MNNTSLKIDFGFGVNAPGLVTEEDFSSFDAAVASSSPNRNGYTLDLAAPSLLEFIENKRDIPILDHHNDFSSISAKGRASNFKVAGDLLTCTLFIDKAEYRFLEKLKKGILKEFSIGIQALEIEDQESTRLITDFDLLEVSVVSVPADKNTKIFNSSTQDQDSPVEAPAPVIKDSRRIKSSYIPPSDFEFLKSASQSRGYVFENDGREEFLKFSIQGKDFSELSLSSKSNPQIFLGAPKITYPLDDLSSLIKASNCREVRLEFFETPPEEMKVLDRSKHNCKTINTKYIDVKGKTYQQSTGVSYFDWKLKDATTNIDGVVQRLFFGSFQKTIYNLILEKINALDLKAPEVIEKITPEKLMERIIQADGNSDYENPVFLISSKAMTTLSTQKYFEHAFLLDKKILGHKVIVIRSWTGEEVLFGDFRSVLKTIIFDDFSLIRETTASEDLLRMTAMCIFGVGINPAHKNFVQKVN